MPPLTPEQIEVIETTVAGLRSAYNDFEVEPCHFTGIPDDLSSLDYIPYELPMPEEYAAGSVAFSLAWGHVYHQQPSPNDGFPLERGLVV